MSSDENNFSFKIEPSKKYLEPFFRLLSNPDHKKTADEKLIKFEKMAGEVLSREGYPPGWVELGERLNEERNIKKVGYDWWPSEIVQLAHEMLFRLGVVRASIKRQETEMAISWTVDLANIAATIQYHMIHKKPAEIAKKVLPGKTPILTEKKKKIINLEYQQKVEDDQAIGDIEKELSEKHECSVKTIRRALGKK